MRARTPLWFRRPETGLCSPPLVAVYAIALLVNAALLFILEPLVGKLVLPLFGSTPQVWTTVVLFFQAALLAGYAFSHFTSRLRPLAQALAQLALLALAAVALPIGISASERPPHSANPVLWLLGLLILTAGAPFFALATNTPTLQRWIGRADPYFLFAASNAGSFIGLLAYPIVLEPSLTLHQQETVWSIGYAVAAGLVACAALFMRPARVEPRASDVLPWRRRLLWLALAAVPSSLMLGTTTYATRDLAPIPLLWVIPLAVYLLTFVVAFAPGVRADRLTRLTSIALPGVAIVVVYTLAVGAQKPLALLLPLHLLGLAVAGLLCHSRLAADRPVVGHLTEYYLWIALGGALGGVFNALLAPLVFPGLVEYPLAIVAACALRPRVPMKRPALLEFFLRDKRPTQAMDLVAPVLVCAVVVLALDAVHSLNARSLVLGAACGLALNVAKRPLRFALALAAVLLAVVFVPADPSSVLARDRSFFGIYRVTADGDAHKLFDGTTLHGEERMRPGKPVPLTYFTHEGPAGQALAELPHSTTQRAGLIGLGTGAIACNARPGARWTFFEIDPVVARIARDPRYFTYLRDCPGSFSVRLGDGRQSIARQPPRAFGLIAIDAFISDAIPVHLITREAFELYLSRLRASGAVLVHITNRYLRLEPVLGDVARELRLTCIAQTDKPSPARLAGGAAQSTWALLARSRADLGALSDNRRWHTCVIDPGAHVWTDDYSSVLGVVKWG